MPALNLYKNAYSGLSRNSWFLSLVMFINRSGTMVVPFMTIYCTQKLHFSIAEAGFIYGLFGAGSVVGAFAGGKITDKIGFHQLQIAALIIGGFLFILLGFQRTFLSLSICSFILSVCNESFRPANSTAIVYYSTPENCTRSYALNRLAINLGWSFGGALGGFLASVNYQLLFWVDGFTNIFAGLLLYKLLSPKNDVKKAGVEKPAGHTRSPYRDKLFLIFLGLVICFAACFFQLFTMHPIFLKTQWHITEQVIGFLMALNGAVIVLIEMILVHNMEGRRPPAFFISLGIFVVGLGYLITNLFAPGIALAVSIVVVVTIGEVLALPFMNSFWTARTTTGNRGRYAALYTIAWSVAQILAPIIGSIMIVQYGYAVLWWLAAVVCFLISFAFACIHISHSKQTARAIN